MLTFSERSTRLFMIGTALALIAGFVIVGTSLLTAQAPEQRFGDPRPPAERPDERTAVTIQQAKDQFQAIPALAEVVRAAEAGEIETLIDMARGGNFCETPFRASEVPEICMAGGNVPAIYIKSGPKDAFLFPIVAPVDDAERYLSILSKVPVALDLVSRDERAGTGQGGEYYLMFRAATPSNQVDTDDTFDRIGMLVKPDEVKPIAWFTRGKTGGNSLRWLQEQSEIQYQVLIAPESVSNLIGIGEIPPGVPTPRPTAR